MKNIFNAIFIFTRMEKIFMDEKNPLRTIAQLSMKLGVEWHRLKYHLRTKPDAPKPENIAGRDLYRREDVIAWWKTVKKWQTKPKENL